MRQLLNLALMKLCASLIPFMPRSAPTTASTRRAASPRLRLGYVPLNDAAPFIVAHETGIFARHGLDVSLKRELGWATIRDKIAYGELDAANALGALLLNAHLGLEAPPCECLTACILSTAGNAITLSQRLWDNGVRDATTLHDEIIRTRHERTLVIGVAARYSSHFLHVCDWLRSGNINPRRDVRIVVVPPPQVYRNLAAGTIDGYCVGEPWNTLAIQNGSGWCPTTSSELHPGHVEKVLLVHADFARQRHDEHLALVAALHEACLQCDEPDFRPEMVKLLARREYLNQSPKVISAGLVGPMQLGRDRSIDAASFVRFGRDDLNNPTPERAGWLTTHFERIGAIPKTPGTAVKVIRETFRADLFRQAVKSAGTPATAASK